MIAVGIDAGSRALKIALLHSGTSEILASGVVDQGVKQEALAKALFEELLDGSGIERGDIDAVVATGYGRDTISFADMTVTEITCHARGVRMVVPDAMTIIDIGGQDSKLTRLDDGGVVRDFVMNDRCAAGTGSFLEVIAERMKVGIEGLGEMVARSRKPAAISSTCVVFAETEILGLLAEGVPPEDIVAGVLRSIATRVSSMAGRNVRPPIVFTGGVALIPGMADALESALGHPVVIAPDPQMTGALGAAIVALGLKASR